VAVRRARVSAPQNSKVISTGYDPRPEDWPNGRLRAGLLPRAKAEGMHLATEAGCGGHRPRGVSQATEYSDPIR